MYILSLFPIISSGISEARVFTLPTSFLSHQVPSSAHNFTHIGHSKGDQSHVWLCISHPSLRTQVLSLREILFWDYLCTLESFSADPHLWHLGNVIIPGELVWLWEKKEQSCSYYEWRSLHPSHRNPNPTHPPSALSLVLTQRKEWMKQALHLYLGPRWHSKMCYTEGLRIRCCQATASTYAYMCDAEKPACVMHRSQHPS